MVYKKDMTSEEREAYNAYMRDYMTRRYHRRRDAAIEALGGRCVECGSREDLELDHVDPSTKSFEIGKILSTGSEAKVEAELAKCVLRCSSCHRTKTAMELDWDRHGTYSSYRRRGCRCDACVEAFRVRSREHKAKHFARKKASR